MVEMGMQDEEFPHPRRIEPERLHLRQDIGQDVAQSAVDQDRAVPAFKIVGSGLFPAQVPQMIRDLARLSESHCVSPPSDAGPSCRAECDFYP